MTETLYSLGYDFAHGLYWAIPAVICLALFSASQALAASQSDESGSSYFKTLLSLRLSAVILLLVFCIGFGSDLAAYLRLAESYSSGSVLRASGEVENFSPGKAFPPSPESFSLGGIEFSCSNYDFAHGYHGAGEDSLITGNGQKLDIAYAETDGKLIILEIIEHKD